MKEKKRKGELQKNGINKNIENMGTTELTLSSPFLS